MEEDVQLLRDIIESLAKEIEEMEPRVDYAHKPPKFRNANQIILDAERRVMGE